MKVNRKEWGFFNEHLWITLFGENILGEKIYALGFYVGSHMLSLDLVFLEITVFWGKRKN